MLMNVIRHNQSPLPHGALWSRSAGHADANSTTLQRVHGQDVRTLHKTPQFILPSLAPLRTNTPGDSGHAYTTHNTTFTTLCSPGAAHWVKQVTVMVQHWCACNKVATP